MNNSAIEYTRSIAAYRQAEWAAEAAAGRTARRVRAAARAGRRTTEAPKAARRRFVAVLGLAR